MARTRPGRTERQARKRPGRKWVEQVRQRGGATLTLTATFRYFLLRPAESQPLKVGRKHSARLWARHRDGDR